MLLLGFSIRLHTCVAQLVLSLVCFAAASAGLIGPAYAPYASPYASPYAAPYAYGSAYGHYAAPAVVSHAVAAPVAYHAPVVKAGSFEEENRKINCRWKSVHIVSFLFMSFWIITVAPVYHAPVVAKHVYPAATSYANTYKVQVLKWSFFLIFLSFNEIDSMKDLKLWLRDLQRLFWSYKFEIIFSPISILCVILSIFLPPLLSRSHNHMLQ